MTSVSNGKILKNVVFFLILLFVTWLAYFFYYPAMGLYEDDYYYIGNSINMNFNDLIELLIIHLKDFEYNQGRYLGESLPYILIHVLFNIFGFKSLYVFGCILVAFNGYLVSKILSKAGFNSFVSLTAALFFILFPADTTKPLLIHIYLLQLSFTFVLAGILLYRRNKLLAFLVGSCSLFIYESAFLPFMTIPLLYAEHLDKKKLISAAKHFSICLLLLASLFIVRKLLGEQRVGGLSMSQFVLDTFLSLFIGPVTVFFTFLNAPYQVLTNLNVPFLIVILIIIIPGFFWILNQRMYLDFSKDWYQNKLHSIKALYRTNKNVQILIHLFFLGILNLGLSYLMSVTHYPPTAYVGRGTSVHLASTFGSSLLFASFVSLIIIIIPRVRYWTIGITSIYLSLLVGYGFLIQLDFVKSWESQRLFWSDINKNCQDVRENTIIIIDRSDLMETKYINSYSWAVPVIFQSIYDFSAQWKHPPKVIVLDPDKDIITENGKYYYLSRDLFFLFENRKMVELEEKNVIVLKKMGDDSLTRLSKSDFLPDHLLKEVELERSIIEKPFHLYKLMLTSSD